MRRLLLIASCSLFILHYSCSQKIPGLQQPVEIIRDRWGINHIYAQNEHDLFFAQGYSAAQDRLFQLELWRRQATGTVAELLGPQEVKRDIGTRLFTFRPTNLDAELRHYHPHGPQIVRAFVAGINAYITEVLKTPDKLPFEFKVLKTTPGLWTPEIVISRHQGLLSNIRDELNYGRLVHILGQERVRELHWFHPVQQEGQPDLTLHVKGEELFQPILELYEAFRLPLKFQQNDPGLGATDEEATNWFEAEKQYVGSNNWVISGSRSSSGYPMLANDPHRAQSTPSLRYWVHLHAPGWNVVGAGEPTLPGVSIGHNDYGAWGLTIFDTDNEDLYVYDINPGNPNQYRYKGGWETMRVLKETIPVKGRPSVTAELKYTRHGPVVFEDKKHNKAYAVRAGWLEAGCAPYLASLRMNQARSWTEFRQACTYSRIPGENMIWAGRPSVGRPSVGRPSVGRPSVGRPSVGRPSVGRPSVGRPSGDKKGTIGWQVVGLAPIRTNWTGLVPVPGDGRFEWSGYLSIPKLPNKLNPAEGYIVTANNNLTPTDYPYRNAIGWVWASPSRAHRIEEVLGNGQRKGLTDFMRLQADYLSIPARTLVPLLEPLSSPDDLTERALSYLRRWDYKMEPGSVAAAIYMAWEDEVRTAYYYETVPEVAQPYFKSLSTKRMIDWAVSPYSVIPPKSGAGHRGIDRDSLLLTCLSRATAELTNRLGPDLDEWQYGQRKNKHITITHPLSALVDESMRKKINLGPVARGGYGETVNATGNTLNQAHGASFRILVDTENWDKTLGINSPGQSGDPESPHYKDLFQLWADNGYFPVYFSKEKVKAVGETTIRLVP